MLQIHLPVGLGLILALGAGSAVWTAKLESRDGSKISGTARVESVPAPAMTPPKDSLIPPAGAPEASPEELRVTVTLSNAPASAALAWYLYSGKCNDTTAGAASSVLGSTSAYSSIKVDAQGNGTATTTVKGAQVAGGNYYVGVLRAEPGGKLAACGNLEREKTSTD